MDNLPQTVELPRTDLIDGILTQVHKAPEPLTVRALHGNLQAPYKRPPLSLQQIVDEQVEGGRLFRYGPYRSQNPRYWDREPQWYAKRLIQDRLSQQAQRGGAQRDRAMTLSGMWTSLNKRLGSLDETKFGDVLQQLINETIIYKLPRLRGASSTRYSTEPPDPSEYLAPHVRRIREWATTLKAVDVPESQTLQAARMLLTREFGVSELEDAERMILNRLRDIEPSTGTGVTLQDLRDALDFRWPEDLDFHETMHRLAEQGRVVLHGEGQPQEHVCVSTLGDPRSEASVPASASMEAQFGRKDLKELILQGIADLRRERFHQTGRVPIHELRSWIAERAGEEASSHRVLDDQLKALRGEGLLRMIAISNTSLATEEQIAGSVPGVHEILFYVEALQ